MAGSPSALSRSGKLLGLLGERIVDFERFLTAFRAAGDGVTDGWLTSDELAAAAGRTEAEVNVLLSLLDSVGAIERSVSPNRRDVVRLVDGLHPRAPQAAAVSAPNDDPMPPTDSAYRDQLVALIRAASLTAAVEPITTDPDAPALGPAARLGTDELEERLAKLITMNSGARVEQLAGADQLSGFHPEARHGDSFAPPSGPIAVHVRDPVGPGPGTTATRRYADASEEEAAPIDVEVDEGGTEPAPADESQATPPDDEGRPVDGPWSCRAPRAPS